MAGWTFSPFIPYCLTNFLCQERSIYHQHADCHHFWHSVAADVSPRVGHSAVSLLAVRIKGGCGWGCSWFFPNMAIVFRGLAE